MMPLDDRTAERVARVIVDIGGPYERPSWELERLLAASGWSDPPAYDQISSRVRWLTEQLIERKNDHADIERLLCCVCDPLEYDDGKESPKSFAAPSTLHSRPKDSSSLPPGVDPYSARCPAPETLFSPHPKTSTVGWER